jgi:hypothetical protein
MAEALSNAVNAASAIGAANDACERLFAASSGNGFHMVTAPRRAAPWVGMCVGWSMSMLFRATGCTSIVASYAASSSDPPLWRPRALAAAAAVGTPQLRDAGAHARR